jgi:hypothetical protein
MTGREMLQEIWREIRDDVRSWNITWRWLTAEELDDLRPRINPATGFPMVRGSMLDAGGNPYVVDLSNFSISHDNSVVDAGKSGAHIQAEFISSGNRTLSDIDRDYCCWPNSQTRQW